MQAQVLEGGFANPSVDAAHAFRAALQALARPGRIERIASAQAPDPVSPAAAGLLLTLCDAETPVHLASSHDSPALREWIAFHTGAPIVRRGEAMFALGRWADLVPLDDFAQGAPEYPDRSATLIVELDHLAPEGARLTGPGIETQAHLSLPEIAAFRANRARYPLGVDFFFTCEDRVAGLPRSTHVEEG
ncbi:phosphonate C-P lyase system protein PhnH [Oceanicella actignis]|uniref:Alpha-D-ribose 1-methylphosphonate 5-triphosphate synthase subunit PhnH n=1 Tax=Oceanicella actignis TaxID=1189325 RepID=A0A1M7U478_9RHOB|nr:phosphonate C-P lyase system protein PhnH [Oceanicella actignis]SET88745.1 alpha-D-ribose 1-methylphosphonate 5-triphosphate synthase subunit PhnH [Oceanicella actignis]SHN77775.1 alpha-D-ribose 1-methylphosphonate 5-triphosphate synthase subunit PhnH [Oceanicella actignis]